MTKVVQNSSLNHFGIWPVLISEKSFPPMLLAHLGWVAIEKCASGLEIHFDQLQVLVSQLSPSKVSRKCIWNGETPQVQQQNQQKNEDKITGFRRNRLFVWVVSLYLCVLMLPWSKKKIHSAQYIAQHCRGSFDISTIFQDILHDWQLSFSIANHDSTFCYCAPAGVSETTSWRNWITPPWPFRAAQRAGTLPSPSAAFKVSWTTSWRNWSSPKNNQLQQATRHFRQRY